MPSLAADSGVSKMGVAETMSSVASLSSSARISREQRTVKCAGLGDF